MFVDLTLVAGTFWTLVFTVNYLGEFEIFETIDAIDVHDPLPAWYYLFNLVLAAIYFCAAGAYAALLESSALQATLGKRLAKIKVVDHHGRRLTLLHALGRWAASSVSYLTLGVGVLVAAFSRNKQALHDLMAETRVVDRWAFTDTPERQSRRMPKRLVAVVALILATPPLAVTALIVALAHSYR